MTDERFGEDEEKEHQKREKTFDHQQRIKAGFKSDLLNDIRKQREIEREKYASELDSDRRDELYDIANQTHIKLKSSFGKRKINGNDLKKEIIAVVDDYIEENEICYIIGIMKGSGHLRHVEQFNIKLDAEEQVYEIQEEPIFVKKSRKKASDLTEKERKEAIWAIKYFVETATHDGEDAEEDDCAGLNRKSPRYEILKSVMMKLENPEPSLTLSAAKGIINSTEKWLLGGYERRRLIKCFEDFFKAKGADLEAKHE